MTKNKTLNERVIEAKFMASLSKIESRDNHKRVKTVLVPASDATFNHVIIRRSNNSIISCECRKHTPIGYIPCQGNLKGVCRHSLAAMFVAMNDNGYTPRFRHDYKDAWNHCMRHIDVMLTDVHTGQMPCVFTLKSHQGKGAVYFVAEEDSAVALKKRPIIKSVTEKLSEYDNGESSWMDNAPESAILDSDSIDRELEKASYRVDTFGRGGLLQRGSVK